MITKEQKDYFSIKYKYQDYQKDLYLLFLERYKSILKENGLLGVIISNTWLQSITLRKIRSYLLTNYEWKKILLLPEKVFKAVVDTHVIIFQNQPPIKSNSIVIEILKSNNIIESHSIKQSDIEINGDPINISVNKKVRNIFEKICNGSKKMNELANVYNGVKPFEIGKGVPPQTKKTLREKPFVAEGERPNKNWKPLLRGGLINRYSNLWEENYWIMYGEWLAAPRDPKIFEYEEKIMIRQTGDSLIATIISKNFIARNNLHIVIPKLTINIKYLLGLVNSKLMDFVYTYINPEKGEALAEVKKQHIEILPIKEIDFKNKYEKEKHDEIVKLVAQLLQLNKDMMETNLPSKREQLQDSIVYNEKKIDELVYELYGLSKQEIEVIENNAQ